MGEALLAQLHDPRANKNLALLEEALHSVAHGAAVERSLKQAPNVSAENNMYGNKNNVSNRIFSRLCFCS